MLPSTGVAPEFEDVNNDGFVDLFVTKGNVEAQVDYASRDPSDLFLGRADGTFRRRREDAGIVSFERARGAAVVDLNLDGMLDLVVVNRREPVKVWRNVGRGDADRAASTGNWLGVRLEQTGPERRRRRRVARGPGRRRGPRQGRSPSAAATPAGRPGWLHTGLGDATEAEVRVQWPDGETGPWMPVAADSFVTIERGAAEPVSWRSRRETMSNGASTRARVADVPLPDFGSPAASRCSPPGSTRARWIGCGPRIDDAATTTCVRLGRPGAQRQPGLT